MRFLIAALALAALAACGRETPQQTVAVAPLPATCEEPAAAVTLRQTRNAPDWLLFARQAGGGDILFNQRSIRRCGDNEAEITVQVHYTQPQLYAEETDRTRTTVRYTIERVRYRYRCSAEEYRVIQRQIVGDHDDIVATIPGPPDLWRPLSPSGVAGLIKQTACVGR